MIICERGQFVFFASTKSASTAIELALEPYASVAIMDPPELKHCNVTNFEKSILAQYPYAKDYERIIVMRDPIDWLFSWYRYRSRKDLENTPRSTARKSFDEFVVAYLQNPQPDFAKVGKPIRMMRNQNNEIKIDRIYKYDKLGTFEAEMRTRLGDDFKIPEGINESPDLEFSLAPENYLNLERHFEDDLEVYNQAIG